MVFFVSWKRICRSYPSDRSAPDVFFLDVKFTVAHAGISNLRTPTCLSEPGLLDQSFFFRIFQIRSLFLIASKRLKQKRLEPMGDNPFPTLATPDRDMALELQSKAKAVNRKVKETMEVKEAKRNKKAVEALMKLRMDTTSLYN